MSRKKSLAEEINSLIDPTPKDIDPESVGFDLRTKKSVGDEEDDLSFQAMSQGSAIRKQLPVELNSSLYQGQVVKRSELNQENDSEPKEEEDEEGDDDEDDLPPSLAKQTSTEAQNGTLESEEEEEEEQVKETAKKKSKKNALEEEEEALQASLRLVSREEQTSGRATLPMEEEEEEEEKEVESRKEGETEDAEAEAPLNLGLDREHEEIEKSQHIRHQRTLWEWTLNLRIRLQKALSHANRLPQHDQYPAFRSQSSELEKGYQAASTRTTEVLSKLLSLQHALTQQSSLTPTTPDPPASLSSPSPSSPSVDGYWSQIQNNFNLLLPWCHETMEKWNKKTLQASGQAGLMDKKFKVINQGVVAQMEWIMKSSDELIKKTQLKRLDYTVLGKRKRQVDEMGGSSVAVEDEDTLAIIDGRKEEYDAEIFDDTDFYQSLLRDIIQSGLEYNSSLEDPALLERAQILKKKTKKKKDRISKDKKIRYVIHPKLVNFVAPVQDSDDTFLVDELLSRLFGQKQFSMPSTSSPSTSSLLKKQQPWINQK